MDPLLVFAASDLDTGGIAIRRELPPSWIAAQLADVEATSEVPGTVVGRLSRSGVDDIVVRADLRADVLVPCARCLKPASIALHGELSLLLRPGKVLPVPAQVVKGSGEGKPAGKKAARGEASAAEGASGKAERGGKNGHAAKNGRTDDQAPGALAARGARLGRAVKVAGAGKLPSDRRGAIRVPEKLQEFEFTSEEADHDLYDGESILLDEFVREALLLEMPNFPLCSEDCAGISPVPAEAGSAGVSVPAGSFPAGAAPPADAASSGDVAESAGRPPGTKSLGDVLRAALAARKQGAPEVGAPDAAPARKPKKR